MEYNKIEREKEVKMRRFGGVLSMPLTWSNNNNNDMGVSRAYFDLYNKMMWRVSIEGCKTHVYRGSVLNVFPSLVYKVS